jgi:pyrroloquinoline-quinone synthase
MDLDILEQALESSLKPHDLLMHPFYRAWSDGTLGREDLARYAAQYAHPVDALPALLRAALERTEDPETRASLQRNLDEEEGRVGVSHAQLWRQFGRAVDAEEGASRLDETGASMDALGELVSTDEVSALAALWAYEVQTARVAETKEVGLVRYGVDAPQALSFFRVHGALDVHHARELREALARALDRGGSLEVACEAVTRSAQAQWTFLDGVERLRQAGLAAA